MYDEFKNSGSPRLTEFFRSYDPPITPRHHTCVGLGLELLCRLREIPGLADKLYLVSCEEAIESPGRYMGEGAPPCMLAEKEHVLVALRIVVAGRPGVLLLDPGYHVARVVTVMADGQYPHTGWFTQKDDKRGLKEYNYTLDSRGLYVEWHVQETSRPAGISTETVNLIYVEKPFLSAVDCAERRNLVYSFKSLLARDTKGHVLAGLYLSLESGDSVTLFCQGEEDGGQVRRKLALNCFAQPQVTADVHELVEEVAEQLRMPSLELMALLCKLARISADRVFVRQVLDINEHINEIAADN